MATAKTSTDIADRPDRNIKLGTIKFQQRNYKVAASVGIELSRLNPVSFLADTFTVPNLVRISYLSVEMNENV